MMLNHECSCRILVVDSDMDTRQLYRELLRPIGCDVVDATDGRDALVSALTHRPTLVITETHLPVFDGYRLCEVLRQDSQTQSVPILVVTGEARSVEVDRAHDAGADCVLVKPVPPDELIAEVKRLIRQLPNGQPAAAGARGESPAARRPRPAKAQRRVEVTTKPAVVAPELRCPACDRPLRYEQSYISGVKTQREQWDTYTCQCGTFEYRQRTRKLRKV